MRHFTSAVWQADGARLTGHRSSFLQKLHRFLANLLGLILARVAVDLHQASTIFAHGFKPLKPFRNRLVKVISGGQWWKARK